MKKTKMKKKIPLIILALIFIILSLFLIFYNKFFVVEVRALPMSVELVDYNIIGINVDTDGLFFDKIQQTGVGKRGIDLANNNDFPVLVSIKTEGNISSMITVSNNDFIIYPNEGTSVIYYCNVGESPMGIYEGKTTIVFRRVLLK